MKVFRSSKDKKAILKALSGLTINLSAGWFGAFVISPNFSPIVGIKEILLLTYDVMFGILFLYLGIKLERKLL